MIQATQLPYGVFTNTVIDQLAEITTENPAYGIEKVVDHTKKNADIRIYLTKGVNPKKMIEKIYKDTALENWFSVNMILLDQGRFPKVFGWRAACDAYISHMRECERNILTFDLDKALGRKNILDGLLIAVANIDEVVAIIRSSDSPAEASKKLIARFNFNEEQTKAILAMKLSTLTKIDAIKLNDEKKEIEEQIEWLQYLLNDTAALDNELIKILREVIQKFGDDRRTVIQNTVEADEEVEIPQEEEVSVMLFDNNTIRVIRKDDLQGGKRGRKGVNVKPPKGANLINTLYTTNVSNIAALTSIGKMYTLSIADLEYEKDYSVYEIIQLQDNEKVKLLIDSTSFNSYHYLITVSKNGFIKKSAIAEYFNMRARKGIAAVKLEDKDSLVGVYLSMNDNDRIMVAASNGCYNYYKVSELSSTGRVTKGVKAIKLVDDEYIVSATLVRDGIEYTGLLTITSSGKGKISPLTDYSETSRAAKGNQIMALKDETIALIYALPASQEKVYLSTDNKAVLLDVSSIPVQNRVTTGVRIIDARTSSTSIEIM